MNKQAQTRRGKRLDACYARRDKMHRRRKVREGMTPGQARQDRWIGYNPVARELVWSFFTAMRLRRPAPPFLRTGRTKRAQ